MDFTEVLELDEQIAQSSLSSQALNKYIEVSTHLINMEDVAAARKLLLSIGFTKKSVEKFIKMAIDNAEMQVSEDFKLMLKGKVSKKYLNLKPQLNSINAFKNTNVIIDFSVPKSTLEILKYASKLKKISFEEMLEMASLGANVLQTRAVELAMRHKVPITVLNSFSNEEGTLVCDEEEIMEKNIVSGIAFQKNQSQLTLTNIEDCLLYTSDAADE